MERGYLIPESQPLQMATCAHCGVGFFLQNPEPSSVIIRMQTHKQSPVQTNNTAVLPYGCLRCHQHQFIEIFYE